MKVASIFTSLDGEVTKGGPLQFSTFIRFGGCNLNCYEKEGGCDAMHSHPLFSSNYHIMTPEEIFEKVNKASGPARFTLTGGEPLVQGYELLELINMLEEDGNEVSVETNGTIPIHSLRENTDATIVMDLKTPSTGIGVEFDLITEMNLNKLLDTDFVKVVVANQSDYLFALGKLITQKITGRIKNTLAQVCIGPKYAGVTPVVPPAMIVEWMKAERLWSWRLNLQLHKMLWPKEVLASLKEGVSFNEAVDNEV